MKRKNKYNGRPGYCCGSSIRVARDDNTTRHMAMADCDDIETKPVTGPFRTVTQTKIESLLELHNGSRGTDCRRLRHTHQLQESPLLLLLLLLLLGRLHRERLM